MKRKIPKPTVMFIATLAGGILIGWLIFGGESMQTKIEPEELVVQTVEEVWTCSMHPNVRQGEPGDCPICGMDLIPVEIQQDIKDPNAIKMTPEAMKLANVSTLIIENSLAQKSISLNGKIQEDERLVFSQTSHVPGRIEKLMVDYTGQFVKKGEPVVYIYSPDLVTAQEELLEAVKMKESQPQLYKAARTKLKNWKLTETQIENIINDGRATENFPVMADVSGYVFKKMVNLGDHVSSGKTMFLIADLSKVWVLFELYESEIDWVKAGDSISFNVQSISDITYKGVITYVDPVINPLTRVAYARVEIDNKNERLKPEMFVSGIVKTDVFNNKGIISVPKTAVMWTGMRSVVYVKTESEESVQFSLRKVTLGTSLGSQYIILDGLNVGDEIAVSGTFSIDAAAQLAGKPSMMNPEGGTVKTGHEHMNMGNESDK